MLILALQFICGFYVVPVPMATAHAQVNRWCVLDDPSQDLMRAATFMQFAMHEREEVMGCVALEHPKGNMTAFVVMTKKEGCTELSCVAAPSGSEEFATKLLRATCAVQPMQPGAFLSPRYHVALKYFQS